MHHPIAWFRLLRDGLHPYVEDGAFLGDGTPLLEKDAYGRWRCRRQGELEVLLSHGYGLPVDLTSRMGGLHHVAKRLNQN